MASSAEFVMKHGAATAAAIVATVGVSWYLETLSSAGVALVFLLFLGVFNGAALAIRALFAKGQSES